MITLKNANGLNYSFEKNEFYVVFEEDNEKKIIDVLTLLQKVETGQILYNHHDVTKIKSNFYRRNKMGIVNSHHNLIEHLTLLENVLLAMEITNNKMPKDKNKVASKLLTDFGFNTKKMKEKAYSLPLLEQQKIALLSLYAMNVEVILMNHPTKFLNKDESESFMEYLKDFVSQTEITVIVITNEKELGKYATKIVYLQKGELLEKE